MLVESLLLALAGTAAGAFGALTLLKVAIASLPVQVPRLAQAGVDLRLLGVALAIVVATAILFGLLPALAALAHAGVRSAQGRQPRRHRRARPALEPRPRRHRGGAGVCRPHGVRPAGAQRLAHAQCGDRRHQPRRHHGDDAVAEQRVSDVAEGGRDLPHAAGDHPHAAGRAIRRRSVGPAARSRLAHALPGRGTRRAGRRTTRSRSTSASAAGTWKRWARR